MKNYAVKVQDLKQFAKDEPGNGGYISEPFSSIARRYFATRLQARIEPLLKSDNPEVRETAEILEFFASTYEKTA